MNSNFAKLVKRLELIKTLISLEEEEDISDQILKFNQQDLTEDIQDIIEDLKQLFYSNALKKIDKFLEKNNQITIFIDPEIEVLRFEAKSLEKRVQYLSDEKIELEKLIHEFNLRYNHELGDIIKEILKYRIEKSKDTPDFDEAKKDYEEFTKDYNISKKEKVYELTETELKEIKEKYRKASKLCHPDVIMEEHKDIAHRIFTELNQAYRINDLLKVSEILEDLKKGFMFSTKADTANKKDSLFKEIERLKNISLQFENLIIQIKSSEAFLKIPSLNSWDKYFEDKKLQLKEHLENLKDGAK